MVANNASLLSVQPLPQNQYVLECHKAASWDQYFSCSFYVNDLSEPVNNSTLACFADDIKLFCRVDSTQNASLLQTDLNNLDIWSNSSGLTFNELKCKSLCITRKSEPIAYPYAIKGKELAKSCAKRGLGIWITSDLTWSKRVLDRCERANKLLGYLKRSCGEIPNVKSRRFIYLSLVRSAFGYSSQAWSPQSSTLIHRAERVQRRGTSSS